MAKHKEWSPALQRELEAPFPAEVVQTKTLKGNKISFVPWHYTVQRLNYLLGDGWSMEPPIPMQAGGKLVIAVGLTILGVTRWNVGDEDAEHEGFGSASVNAFAQSYKRAAALFGIGLDMYDKTGKAGAVRQEIAEDAEHRELLANIYEHSKRVPKDHIATIDGLDVNLRKYISDRWEDIKTDVGLARLVGDAVARFVPVRS